ncbi:hypothetical protein NT03LS_0068, partial [Listeria seeligeri FSL N1-067]
MNIVILKMLTSYKKVCEVFKRNMKTTAFFQLHRSCKKASFS